MRLVNWGWVAFALAAVVFLAIKIDAAGYAASDENTYYKRGEFFVAGEVPYVDFFFAHPPLQAYMYAVVFKLFGFNLGILKFLSAAAAVIAAFFVFRLLNEKSQIAAVTAILLFFFTHAILLFTSFPTGTEFVMMFSAAGFYYFHKKRSVVSGVLLGFGAITGLLALIPAAVMAGWLLIRGLGEFRKFMMGFLAVFATVNALFLAITRGDYVTQTITYHLLKPEGVLDKAAVITRVVTRNWLILAASATAVFAKSKFRRQVAVPFFIIAACVAVFLFMKTFFDYYILNMLPFLAILAGQGISGIIETFRVRRVLAYGSVLAVMAVVGFLNYGSFAANDAYDFENAREIANFVKENSDEGELVFGEDATAPLISLLSERGIALDFVDSNDLRFRTGMEDADIVINKLRGNLKFFLVRSLDFGEGVKLGYGVGTLPEFDAFIKEDCAVAKKFETPWKGRVKEYYVYDCG